MRDSFFFVRQHSQAGPPKIFIQSSEHIEVLYYTPAHEYLVTHLIRAYENALNFERNQFHFTPSRKVSVLIEDFGDYGHGAAGTVPSNFIDVGIAPFSYTYETLPANERMTWIINHESIHVVMGDQANSVDRKFRSLFFGKVAPTDEEPLSVLYSSLDQPPALCHAMVSRGYRDVHGDLDVGRTGARPGRL